MSSLQSAFVLLLFAIVAIVQQCQAVSPIDSLRHDYLKLESKSWKLIYQQWHDKLSDSMRTKLLKEIFIYHNDFVRDNLTSFAANMAHETSLTFAEFDHMYEWRHVERDLAVINDLHKTFQLYIGEELEKPSFDLLRGLDFVETVLNDQTWPIPKMLDQIDNVMTGQALYFKMLMEVKDHVCSSHRSAQQVLYHMYTAISLTELKGYAMMQFSWMLLKMYNKGNYTKEADLMRSRFEIRTNRTQQLLKRVMQQASNAIWRCDPSNHTEGQSFVRLTRLLQGYVENEVDMNNEGTCRETCDHYQYTESFGCFKDLYCSKQPKCTGKLLYCKYVDSDMWICPARARSDRRYEYIEYENGRVMGKKDVCKRGTTKVDSWWRYLFWHCSYCFCICDEQGYNSDRYFNLRESLSDTSSNKVVTGVRFRKENRIIHLQIQEGVLLPNGIINKTTTSWQPVNNYKLLDRDVRDGVDYHTMAWNKRAIDLDDLMGKPSTVVTGIRFRVIGSHLQLEVRLTEFDFETGRLIQPNSTSIWHSSDTTESSMGDQRRTEIKLKDPAVPTSVRGKSDISSKSNQFIEFTHTGFDADAAQTTIPYIDAQDTVPEPPVPLVGIGLYYKKNLQSGGFIGPKIFTYDISPHIQKPTPSNRV